MGTLPISPEVTVGVSDPSPYLVSYGDLAIPAGSSTTLDQYKAVVTVPNGQQINVPQYIITDASKLWGSHHSYTRCKVGKDLKKQIPDITINYTQPHNPNGGNTPTLPNMFGLNTTTRVEADGNLSDAAEVVFSYGNQLAEGFIARTRLADGRNIEFPALIVEVDRNYSPGRIGEQLIIISKFHLRNLDLTDDDMIAFQAHMQANTIPVALVDDPLFNIEIEDIPNKSHRKQYTVHATIPEKIWEENSVTVDLTFNNFYPKPGNRGFLGWLACAFNSDNGNIGAHFQPARHAQVVEGRALSSGANGTIRLDDIRLGPKEKKSIVFSVEGNSDAKLDPLKISPFVNQPLAMVLAQRIAVWMDGEHLISSDGATDGFAGIKRGNGVTINEEIAVHEKDGVRTTTITSFPSPYFIELHETRIDVPGQSKPAYSLTEYVVREIPPNETDLNDARQVAKVVFEFGCGDNKQGLPDPSYAYDVSGGPCVGSYKLFIGDEHDGNVKVFSHGLVTCQTFEVNEAGKEYVRTDVSLEAFNTLPNTFKDTSFSFVISKDGEEKGYSLTHNALKMEYVSPN